MTNPVAVAPVRSFKADALEVRVYASSDELSRAVAEEVNDYLGETLARQGSAAAILATGRSQIKFLAQLVEMDGVDWSKVTLFHMDEYLGISPDHPGSFRRYMRERVESLVQPKVFHYIQGEAGLPIKECERYEKLLRAQPIDLCCLGIGENGHLAFNDPPVADFHDERFVKILKLDDLCKQQQLKEGFFPSFDAIPPYAFSLTIPALCAVKRMVCICPDKRKAVPVRNTLRGPISTACPASILRKQSHAVLLLDQDSASLLD